MKFVSSWISRSSIFVAAVLLAGCASMGGGGTPVTISGAEEVPPVTSSASGSGTVTVNDDRTVSGKFKLKDGGHLTVAHIHEGAAGANGPVIIPLRKTADNEWEVPADAKPLTESQYASYKAGRLYVNFHSAKYKGGEIRGQIRPSGGSGGY